MGFRYRKSIGVGKYFRINVSKSGIGYSFGVPGARITHSANGRVTTTVGLPGTGISYSTVIQRENQILLKTRTLITPSAFIILLNTLIWTLYNPPIF